MTELQNYPEYEFQVLESDLDSFGHVNNANYLKMFENARWDLMTSRGYSIKEVHARKIGPVILEINLKFKRELKNREHVKIKTSMLSHSGKISVFRQVMINEKGEESCIGDFTFGLFDLTQRKLIDYTPEWKHVLGLP
jgi:YbgC/YbaW family acyl-CoA thioester hydrolase